MKPLSEFMGKIREVAERAKAHAETPEWQAKLSELRAADEAEQQRQRMRQLEALWEARGIPAIFRRDLRNLRGTSAIEAVNRFITPGNPQWVLVLAGERGTGKSFAAASALADMDTPRYELVERPDGYQVARSTNGVQSVRDGMFVFVSDVIARGGFDREYRERLQTVPLLVLDEMGGEVSDGKGFSKGHLVQILSARYHALTKTIITTNLSYPDFFALYGGDAGARLVDRMRDGGVFFQVEEQKSFRGRAGGDA